jgi:hypothetical protein
LVPPWFGWREKLRMRRLWWSQSRNRAQTENKLQRILDRFSLGTMAGAFDLDAVLGAGH